ncbi:unnamed protein product [Cunninghamella blakesleeana]
MINHSLNTSDASTSKKLIKAEVIETEYYEKYIEANNDQHVSLFKNPYLLMVTFIGSFGGIIFGYDQGVIAGVQEMESFKQRFSMTPIENGLVVSILELGAWFGTFLFAYLADKLSRKYSIGIAAVIFLVGSTIQAAALVITHLYVGKFLGGIGVGGISALIPTYLSELAPPEIRGSILATNIFFINFGVCISFWIDFGSSYLDGEMSWRLPLYLQLVLGTVILCGIFFLPFSPRWLMAMGREKEALFVLSRLRKSPIDDLNVIEEWKDIKANVLFDKRLDQQYFNLHLNDDDDTEKKKKKLSSIKKIWISYTCLFRDGMWKTSLIGVTLFFFQQYMGINAVVYYAPYIVGSLGMKGIQSKLLATGVVGILSVFMGLLSIFYVDKWKRRTALMSGSFGMGAAITTMGILASLFQKDWSSHVTEGWVAVGFLYIYLFCFGFSWGPCTWIVSGELFPLRVRAKGVGLTSSSHWLNNFVIGLITPPLLAASAPAAYFLFGGFCFASIFFIWFFLPETRGICIDRLDDAQELKNIRKEVDLMNIPISECSSQL